MSHSLLEGLNDKQYQAITAPLSNLLVLAGAGSGKTRVLTHRIAWLLQEQQQSPYAILAVTFTNKAAAEMRSRIESLVGHGARSMWVGTFHGLAHRLLRAHYQEVGLPQSFQIIDSDDQLRMLKRLMKEMNLDEKRWPPRQAQGFINAKKDEGLYPKHIDPAHPVEQTWCRVYAAYQEACDRAGLVDFSELLLRAHRLWLECPHILAHYQQRFSHILVDEFQDTNAIQYAWIKLLAGSTSNVMIVGDDDQSIYGWRGAKVENLNRFLSDFNDAQVIRLEQNYRSTGNILNAANALIANNQDRLGKELWTQDSKGDPIRIYCAFNELDESRFIVYRLQTWMREGGSLKDCAILYRSNAQSRVLEEALMHQGLAYRIYGGMRFFDRQEIKDALGYLRLVANRDDDAAFERIVNTPARGIGGKTLDAIRVSAREQGITLWRASQNLLSDGLLKGRSATVISAFLELINQLDEHCVKQELATMVDYCVVHSGLKAMYAQEKGEKAAARIENLEELVTAAGSFILPEEAEQIGELSSFLAYAALESGEGQAGEHDDAVQLMTLHAAKGLEFPMVFVAGVEEGLFPSEQSISQPQRLDEERRLCYVGMTRAMKHLYLTYAQSRRIYGREREALPSRFIHEIPDEYLEHIRVQSQVRSSFRSTKPVSRPAMVGSSEVVEGLKLGQRVRHPKFGRGVIIGYEGSGEKTRIQVNFERYGEKWLVQAYARLEPVS